MTDEHHAEAILRAAVAAWMYTKPGRAPKYGVRGLRLTESGWTETSLYPASAILDAVREVTGQHDALIAALAKVMPVRVHNGQDYAEVYFSDGTNRSTHAMTMNPQDWQDITNAFKALATGDKP